MSALTKSRVPLAARLLSIPVVAVTVAAGVWLAGGVVTDDFRVAMALTGAWFVLSGLACLAIALRAPAFRLPVLAGYAVTAAVIGGYLGLATLRDRVVDERVVVGTPRAEAARPGVEPANVELVRGRFRSGEHRTAGVAAVVRLAEGRRLLTLTSFDTAAGPDLRVRLVPGDSTDAGAAGAVDLGALKGNRGDQQYRLPADVAVGDRTVVIWCRAFSVAFGSARLD